MGTAAFGVAIGVVYVAVALIVLRQARGSAGTFPWLIVLAVFFIVRGVDRVTETITEHGSSVISHVADALVLLTLVLLVHGLRRTVADLRRAFEQAERQSARYARALTDYERLTRHRLANPIAAIRGGIATVREVETLTPAERDELLAMVEKEALRLASLSLDPRRLSPEERKLRPRPGDVEYPDAA